MYFDAKGDMYKCFLECLSPELQPANYHGAVVRRFTDRVGPNSNYVGSFEWHFVRPDAEGVQCHDTHGTRQIIFLIARALINRPCIYITANINPGRKLHIVVDLYQI